MTPELSSHLHPLYDDCSLGLDLELSGHDTVLSSDRSTPPEKPPISAHMRSL